MAGHGWREYSPDWAGVTEGEEEASAPSASRDSGGICSQRRQSRLVRRAKRRRVGRVYRARRGEGRHDVYPASSVAGGGFSVRRRRVLCDHIAGLLYALLDLGCMRVSVSFAFKLGGWVGTAYIHLLLCFLVLTPPSPTSTALPLPSLSALPSTTFRGAVPPAACSAPYVQ